MGWENLGRSWDHLLLILWISNRENLKRKIKDVIGRNVTGPNGTQPTQSKPWHPPIPCPPPTLLHNASSFGTHLLFSVHRSHSSPPKSMSSSPSSSPHPTRLCACQDWTWRPLCLLMCVFLSTAHIVFPLLNAIDIDIHPDLQSNGSSWDSSVVDRPHHLH
jgi:hypothetical protein